MVVVFAVMSIRHRPQESSHAVSNLSHVGIVLDEIDSSPCKTMRASTTESEHTVPKSSLSGWILGS